MASRPYGFLGNPLFASGVISVQVSPRSVERNNPLAEGLSGPSPPERYSHPFRRKSHMQAKITPGFAGSIATSVQPVERLGPLRTCFQVFPPSVVLYRPRFCESLQSAPGTAAYASSLLVGLTAMRAIRS